MKVTDVRSFLGLASYYHLTATLLPRKQRSLSGAQTVTLPSVLAFPCFDEEFIVDCDASDYGLGAVILQRQDGDEKVIVYTSRVLEDRECRYSTTNQEMLAMVYAIKHFCHYLYRRPFTVRTDHNALKWLQSFKEPKGQVA